MAIPVVNLYDNDIPISEVNEPKEKPVSGFVSLYRSIQNHWLWQDAEKLKWWIDILLEVNYAPQKVLIGGQLIVCKRGQSLKSLGTWAQRWKTNQSAVRRFFILLQNDSMIELENVSKTTRLTVCKYECYQINRIDNESKMNHKRIGNESEMKTNNKDNNTNNVLGDKSPPKKTSFKKWTVDDFVENIKEYGDDYHADLLNGFFKHWSEKAPSGKMKFQLQDTWETSKRLSTWQTNAEKWKK